MDYREIQNLIKLAGSSNISELKLKDGDFKLTIRTKDYQKNTYLPNQQVQPVVTNVQPFYAASSEPSVAMASDTGFDEKRVDQPVTANEVKTGFIEIKSPIVGTFYRSPSPDKEAYVKIGDMISANSVVCIVEAMKLFNEIESEVTGKIVDILVDDGSPVEYDQILFLIDPKA
jgi:acetyl-CoA carboxylase biotin carboxyl carrier protein